MKKALLILPLIILSGCNQKYENNYGIGYTDPDTKLPRELMLTLENLEGTFFSTNLGNNGRLCMDESEPEVVPLFQSNIPFLSEVKRTAYICGDQYVIYDFEHEDAYYGIFNLKDHSTVK